MKKLLLCLLVGVMSLTSCELSDPDGLADPMKWSKVPSGLKNGERGRVIFKECLLLIYKLRKIYYNK